MEVIQVAIHTFINFLFANQKEKYVDSYICQFQDAMQKSLVTYILNHTFIFEFEESITIRYYKYQCFEPVNFEKKKYMNIQLLPGPKYI